MHNGVPLADLPCASALHRVVHQVGALLERDVAWIYGRRYHLVLEGEWTIAVSPDTAGRVRVETCHYTRPLVARWVRAHDHDRLASVVRELEAGGAPVGA